MSLSYRDQAGISLLQRDSTPDTAHQGRVTCLIQVLVETNITIKLSYINVTVAGGQRFWVFLGGETPLEI